jgi:hypothetical protein
MPAMAMARAMARIGWSWSWSATDATHTVSLSLISSSGVSDAARPAESGQTGAASVRSVSPSLTACPSLTRTASTVPAAGASTGISIFIDSRMTQTWPSATASPCLTSIFHTVPVM